jgi:cysteinyl-tRNA synthetase
MKYTLAIFWSLLFLLCCSTVDDSQSSDNVLPLNEIKFWAYQIQCISENGAVDQLTNSHYDLLVLEPTRTDWSSDDKFFDTRAMVERLKNSLASDGIHRKLVIAYIDIGEAEDWRWYWTWSQEWEPGEPRPPDWPDFILTHDPDGWEGNYPVAYWDSRWKDIVIYGNNQNSSPFGDYTSVIDETIKDGFDGIYLDWVEGFENEAVIEAAQKQGKNPRVEMINFIREMRDYAQTRTTPFFIIQQNGSALAQGHPELFSIIDGIAQEGIWYEGDATDNWNDQDGYDWNVPEDWRQEYLNNLSLFQSQGLPVFDCEYALQFAGDAYDKSYNQNFIPYCTRRSLSQLTTTPPPGY